MFVTRASERAFPPRDFPTLLALSSAVALRACAIDSCVSVRCLLSGGNARTQKKVFSKKQQKKVCQKMLKKPYKKHDQKFMFSHAFFTFP